MRSAIDARLSPRRTTAATLLVALLALAGCRTPDVRRPLDEEALLAAVTEKRAPRTKAEPLSLTEAHARLRRGNPRVREAWARYESARHAAGIRTPRPNPTLNLAPLVLGAPGILAGLRAGVDLMVGWSVPVTGRLRMQDDVNAVRAEEARVQAVGTERREYLALRGELLAITLRQEAVDAREGLVTAAEASAEAARVAAEAGAATALDVRLLELEIAGLQTDMLEAEAAGSMARHAAARRMGLALPDAGTLGFTDLPPLPQATPALDELRGLALEQHPRLAALRAAYLVAEKELRLEMARRYPDLGLGLGVEKEGGDDRFSLPLGIEIPVNDKNQQAIGKALARRERLRSDFATALTEILGDLESRRAEITWTQRRLEGIEAQAAPAAATEELARKMRDEAGGLDMLRFLEVARATRRVQLRRTRARLALYEAWSALEVACGAPLLAFPEAP